MSEQWRQGRKVPRNVYEGDRPVAMLATEEDARLIVAAVNWYRAAQAIVPRRPGKGGFADEPPL